MLIHRDILAAVKQAASKTDSRYNLEGVRLDGGAIVATGGHVLLYHDTPADTAPENYPELPPGFRTPVSDAGAEVSATVPLTVVDSAIKAVRGRHYIPAYQHIVATPLEGHGARIVATSGNGSVPVDVDVDTDPDGPRFPDWRNILIKGDTRIRLVLGASQLEQLVKAAKVAGGRDARVIFELTEIPKDGQVRQGVRLEIPTEQGDPIKGVIMPRSD